MRFRRWIVEFLFLFRNAVLVGQGADWKARAKFLKMGGETSGGAILEDEKANIFAGGCLCGAVRYEAEGPPLYAGFCYCADCRKASGSGFMPFLGFAASAVRFGGAPRQFRSKSLGGTPATRNFCSDCGGPVFGGEAGSDSSHTIYAGSLDDPALFKPTIAIFDRERPPWVPAPEGVRRFAAMPE
jgi:hypothetical protein